MDFCVHAHASPEFNYNCYDCDLKFPSDDCENCPYNLPYDEYWGNKADFDYDFLIMMH